jgi:hypothetical protein
MLKYQISWKSVAWELNCSMRTDMTKQSLFASLWTRLQMAYDIVCFCVSLLCPHLRSLSRCPNCHETKKYQCYAIGWYSNCVRLRSYTVCSTRYRTRLAGGPLLRVATIRRTTDTFLFISHTTNVPLFKFRCNIFIGVRIIKEMSGAVASGTHCTVCNNYMANMLTREAGTTLAQGCSRCCFDI